MDEYRNSRSCVGRCPKSCPWQMVVCAHLLYCGGLKGLRNINIAFYSTIISSSSISCYCLSASSLYLGLSIQIIKLSLSFAWVQSKQPLPSSSPSCFADNPPRLLWFKMILLLTMPINSRKIRRRISSSVQTLTPTAVHVSIHPEAHEKTQEPRNRDLACRPGTN